MESLWAAFVVTNGDNLRAELFPFVPVRQNGRPWMSGINGHKSTL
jgi:hypothetical protein